jgi:hypothetical protein
LVHKEDNHLKFNLPLCGSLVVLTAVAAQASPVLVTGAPADSFLSTPTAPFPTAGTLLNFNSISTSSNCDSFAEGCPTFNPSTFAPDGVTISSPDGLLVYPFSVQTAPNELFDDSSNGSANITIDVTAGTSEIGVGLSDFDTVDNLGTDGVTIFLQPLNNAGGDLGPDFPVTLPTEGTLAGQGYFIVEDTTADIYGLQITQPVGNANFSGLALADVETTTTPEPSSALLLTAGVALLGFFRLRKRA